MRPWSRSNPNDPRPILTPGTSSGASENLNKSGSRITGSNIYIKLCWIVIHHFSVANRRILKCGAAISPDKILGNSIKKKSHSHRNCGSGSIFKACFYSASVSPAVTNSADSSEPRSLKANQAAPRPIAFTKIAITQPKYGTQARST